MPTYSYECTDCANRFDVVQAFTDDTLTTCEKCAGRLRKLFNTVGVVFKGSGFYRTDSRESAKKNDSTSGSSNNESTSSESKSSESKSSSSTEKLSSNSTPATANASS